MNNVVRRISLDLSRRGNVNIAFSSQSDCNSRTFLITLFDDGVRYILNDAITVYVNIMRSDGTNAAYMAKVTEDGCIEYTADSWALGVAGITKFSVSLNDGNGKKLTSSTFTVDVAPGLYLGEDINDSIAMPTIFDNMMNRLSNVNNAEAARAEKEQQRVNNESTRMSNEITRIDQESRRQTNESLRCENEEQRIQLAESIIQAVDNLLAIQQIYINSGGLDE